MDEIMSRLFFQPQAGNVQGRKKYWSGLNKTYHHHFGNKIKHIMITLEIK